LLVVAAMVVAAEVVNSELANSRASQVASEVDPALVDITTNLAYQDAGLAGTGMVISSSGEVLTNNHVIEGSSTIKVRDVGTGRTYRATVLGTDVSDDLALLQLTGASHLRTISTANSSAVFVGQSVVALGNAGGTGGIPSVATGDVVALGVSIVAGDEATNSSEQLTGLIETTATLQPGDSGGALVDTSGRVIGVDTAGSTSYFLQSQASEGFAIPIDRAMGVARQIRAGHSSATVHIGASAFLGVDVISVTPRSGAYVTGVISGSPAAAAGLGDGDLIVSIANQPVDSPTTLEQVMQSEHPGDVVQVEWIDPFGALESATAALVAGPPA